jgi:hypothetical protein
MSQYLSSLHGVQLVLWNLVHPKLNVFTSVRVQGQTVKSALDLSRHEPETLLRAVPCLSSTPPLLCNKQLLRHQMQSWDSSVTTVTGPWAVV